MTKDDPRARLNLESRARRIRRKQASEPGRWAEYSARKNVVIDSWLAGEISREALEVQLARLEREMGL